MRFRRLIPLLVLLIPFTSMGLFVFLKWQKYRMNHTSGPPLAVHNLTARPHDSHLPVLWQAPSFAYPNQDGKILTERQLLGHVWVADFIFTRCTASCPTMTAKMVLLQRTARNPELRFVSFSVDPDHDTPPVLKHYASDWHGDELRWRLLSTDSKTLSQIAAAMKVVVKATNDQDNPIIHSDKFILVDQQGRVRSVYDSVSEDAMVRLAADASALAGENSAAATANVTATRSPEKAGEALFSSLGCAACHSRRQIAPPISGLYGNQVELISGQHVSADEAYLRESIIDPKAKIVAGYAVDMPNYSTYVSGEQLNQLMAYIRSLGGKAHEMDGAMEADETSGAMKQSVEIDPVCKMKVVTDANTPCYVMD